MLTYQSASPSGWVAASPSVGGGSGVAVGTFASLPGTCAVGDMYVFTDSVFNYAVCTTTNVWRYFLHGKEGNPVSPASGWTGTNNGANWTATDAGGSVHVVMTNGGANWRFLRRSVPGSTPYTVTTYLTVFAGVSNTALNGIYFYDGTKLMGIEFMTQASVNTLRVQKMNNVTTDNSTPASMASNAFILPSFVSGTWLRLANNGTNLIFSYSLDGVTFTSMFSEAVGTFITPTSYGVGGLNASSVDSRTSFHSVFVE